MVRRLKAGTLKPSTEREPVPKVIPFEDQAHFIRVIWRRIAQRTFKAMTKAAQ